MKTSIINGSEVSRLSVAIQALFRLANFQHFHLFAKNTFTI